LQRCPQLGNAPGRLIHNEVHAVADEQCIQDAVGLFEGITYGSRPVRHNREHGTVQFGFESGRRVAIEDMALVQQRHPVTAFGFVEVRRGHENGDSFAEERIQNPPEVPA